MKEKTKHKTPKKTNSQFLGKINPTQNRIYWSGLR